MDDADAEHRAVLGVLVEMHVHMDVLFRFVAVRVAMEEPEFDEQPEDPDDHEHDRNGELEIREDTLQDCGPEFVQEDRDDRRGDHVPRGPAHAHQRRLAKALAARQQVGDGDEVVRVVAVLEPQRKGEDDEERGIDGHRRSHDRSTTAVTRFAPT